MTASGLRDARLIALERRERLVALCFVAPSLLFLSVFFFLPLLGFLWRGIYTNHLTLEYYERALSERTYVLILLRTLWICLATATCCLLCGYPVAYLLANGSARVRNVILALVLVPFWTNVLVRVFAWIALLGRYGIINNALMQSGITDRPLSLLYNTFAVLLGLTHVTLPYMILPCYAAMRNIPEGLTHAARNLGASPWRAWLRIYLPLSMPGVAAGFLLVFIVAGGFFITPQLMGGGSASGTLLSQLIEREIADSNNWSFSAALSGILLITTTVLYLVYDRFTATDAVNAPP